MTKLRLDHNNNLDYIILIGPEGGFSQEEIAFITASKYVTTISLGDNILRVDTAIVAAISLYCSYLQK